MTTDWKALCAQLAENVRYLLDCVADGDSDPVAIAECVQHVGATRAILSPPAPSSPLKPMSTDFKTEPPWQKGGERVAIPPEYTIAAELRGEDQPSSEERY